MRIAIIGNCQSGAIGSCLERNRYIELGAVIDVNEKGTEGYLHAEHRILHVRDFDFVITQLLSNEFGDISTESIKSLYGNKCLTFTNIYFNGLHPDISYFGSFGNRISSPVGDYHSKICLIAFAKGINLFDTIEIFNHDTYTKLGYYDEFDKSAAELRRRDENIDIKFAADFLHGLRHTYPLYSLNHPTSHIIKEIADKISRHLCGYGLEYDEQMFDNKLVKSAIWPLYKEILQHHDLPYAPTELYFPPQYIGKKPLTRRQFVEQSFRIYSEVGSDRFFSVPIANEFKNVEI